MVTLRCPLAAARHRARQLQYRNSPPCATTARTLHLDGIGATCPTAAAGGQRMLRPMPTNLYSNTITGVVRATARQTTPPRRARCALPACNRWMGCVRVAGIGPVRPRCRAACCHRIASVNGSPPCVRRDLRWSCRSRTRRAVVAVWCALRPLGRLTAPPDAVQFRHGDFAEPLAWCSNGLGWNARIARGRASITTITACCTIICRRVRH